MQLTAAADNAMSGTSRYINLFIMCAAAAAAADIKDKRAEKNRRHDAANK